ncbi:MAG: hypothetical protein IJQ05_06390 [Bacteroidaceae bacterium]|nr:hypothetical protein [Bacteroidaceae bacterium]MCR5333824.1 hypothetical protein [Bacteroidaceae bacterium]
MTSIQMNAELLRNMSIIAEDDNLLKRAAKYMRKLVAEKEADPTLLSKEEFFARVEKARKQAEQGQVHRIETKDELNQFLNSI